MIPRLYFGVNAFLCTEEDKQKWAPTEAVASETKSFSQSVSLMDYCASQKRRESFAPRPSSPPVRSCSLFPSSLRANR
jgi:hypothetical protein